MHKKFNKKTNVFPQNLIDFTTHQNHFLLNSANLFLGAHLFVLYEKKSRISIIEVNICFTCI